MPEIGENTSHIDRKQRYEQKATDFNNPDMFRRVMGTLGATYEGSLRNLERWNADERLMKEKDTPEGMRNFSELRGRVDAYKEILGSLGQHDLLVAVHDSVREEQQTK